MKKPKKPRGAAFLEMSKTGFPLTVLATTESMADVVNGKVFCCIGCENGWRRKSAQDGDYHDIPPDEGFGIWRCRLDYYEVSSIKKRRLHDT